MKRPRLAGNCNEVIDFTCEMNEAILPAATDDIHQNALIRFIGDKDAGIRWIPLKQNPAYELYSPKNLLYLTYELFP